MITDPNIPDPDTLYEALLEAARGRTEAEALGFALRLALLLANQIGDQAILMQAVAAARDTTPPEHAA